MPVAALAAGSVLWPSLISAAGAVGGAILSANSQQPQQPQVAGGTNVGGGSQMQVQPAQSGNSNPAAFGQFL